MTDLEGAFDIEESFPNPFSYMDRALLKAMETSEIKIQFTGYGGDYWVSWKGHSVIPDLLNKKKYKDAFALINSFRQGEQNSFFETLRIMYVAYTPWYKLLRAAVRHNKNDRQEPSTLQERFVKKFSKPPLDRYKDHGETIKELVNTGSIGRRVAMCYNRNGNFKMDSAIPLFDKNIYELLSDLPLPLFVKGGNTRSLIRNVMKGINPPEINNRKDKLPYSPGFSKRIIDERSFLDHLVNSPEYNFVFNNYIDKGIVKNQMGDIRFDEKCISPEKIIGLRIAQAGIVCLAQKYLNDRGYYFNDLYLNS